jgi:hypothetical protein
MVAAVTHPTSYSGELSAQDTVRRDALSTVLVHAAARAVNGEPAADAEPAPARTESPLSQDQVGEVDAAAVARWFVSRYRDGEYPGLVVGSPTGAAVHLAAALGVPWLPAGFDVAVARPAGDAGDTSRLDDVSRALEDGRAPADAVMAANPDVCVRQVYDPVGRRAASGSMVDLRVQWTRLPAAYQEFLATRLGPYAPLILVRDVGRWLVSRGGTGHSFQLGTRAGGLTAAEYYQGSDRLRLALRTLGSRSGVLNRVPRPTEAQCDTAVPGPFADHIGRLCAADRRPIRQVLFARPDALSRCVAELTRTRLREAGRPGDRLIVECGRLTDPARVRRAGLVPYWCDHPLHQVVDELEWWLAGSRTFGTIDVLVDPPGASYPGVASLNRWTTIASFAGRQGAVDRRCARSYPIGSVPPQHVSTVFRQYPQEPALGPLPADAAMRLLAGAVDLTGLLIV